MTNTQQLNPFWDLPETALWICTRDPEHVKHLSGMDQSDRLACAMVGIKPVIGWIGPVAPELDETIAMGPGVAQQKLLEKVWAGRVRISATKVGSNDERLVVSPAELHGLELYIQADNGPPTIGLYCRRRNRLIWRDLLFLRSDIVRIWPAQSAHAVQRQKTAAATGAILAHLRMIMSPDAPLTKPEAKKRCLAEVPNGYPEAFKRAWGKFDSSLKRKRGQHGPRSY